MTTADKSIIITGGAGYIGSVAAELFKQQGWTVIIVDDLSTGFQHNVHDTPFYHADYGTSDWITDACNRFNPSILMHFAACALVGESMEQPHKYYENNVVKFISLLHNMIHYSITNIIFSSSAAVYGEPNTIPIPENHPQLPTNVYGHTKKICEEILHHYDAVCNMKYIALRYFNASGAASEFGLGEQHEIETHLVPNLLLAAAGKEPSFKLFGDDYPTKDGTCIRDFIHVLDIAQAHILAANALIANKTSNIFNIGNELGFSIKDVINTTLSIVQKDIPVEIAPRRPGDPSALIADSKKIQHTLGWKPRYSNLETIIGTQWQFMQSEEEGTKE